jgi:hypothetical protein
MGMRREGSKMADNRSAGKSMEGEGREWMRWEAVAGLKGFQYPTLWPNIKF